MKQKGEEALVILVPHEFAEELQRESRRHLELHL